MFFENFPNHTYFNLRCGKQNNSTTPFRFGSLLDKPYVRRCPTLQIKAQSMSDQITLTNDFKF